MGNGLILLDGHNNHTQNRNLDHCGHGSLLPQSKETSKFTLQITTNVMETFNHFERDRDKALFDLSRWKPLGTTHFKGVAAACGLPGDGIQLRGSAVLATVFLVEWEFLPRQKRLGPTFC